MQERIRELRKNHLHLSQTEFGERLGVSRSVINNIERGVLARPEQKLSLIKLICSEFNVSEKWLRTGEGEMFVPTPSSTMERLKKEFGLDQFSADLVYEYLKLDADQRKAVRDFFYRVMAADKKEEPPEAGIDIDQEAEDYRQELKIAASQAGKSSASAGTCGGVERLKA